MSELSAYKQNRVNELTKNYNLNVMRLNTYTVQIINQINRSFSRTKQRQINEQIVKYNNTLNALKIKLNNDINTANAYQPTTIETILRKKGLLIGCNYSNTEYKLSGCIDDAERVKTLLNTYGFNDIQVLTDNSVLKPTKTNILNEFKKLIVNSVAEDVLFFYFSGHGSYFKDTNRDEIDGRDELIISSDLQGIKDDELRNIITTYMKEGVKLIGLFDSCFSGTMLDLKYNYFDSTNFDQYSENNNVGDCKGDIFMISGCSDEQTSAETFVDNKVQGALTWSFIDGLNKLPNCTWRELIKKMRDTLKQGEYTQIPQLSSGSFENIDIQINL